MNTILSTSNDGGEGQICENNDATMRRILDWCPYGAVLLHREQMAQARLLPQVQHNRITQQGCGLQLVSDLRIDHQHVA